jgi:hypothetical protein
MRHALILKKLITIVVLSAFDSFLDSLQTTLVVHLVPVNMQFKRSVFGYRDCNSIQHIISAFRAKLLGHVGSCVAARSKNKYIRRRCLTYRQRRMNDFKVLIMQPSIEIRFIFMCIRTF